MNAHIYIYVFMIQVFQEIYLLICGRASHKLAAATNGDWQFA